MYFYCSIDGPSEAVTGGDLVVDSRYNYVGTVAASGRVWHQIQMDSTWTAGGGLVEDRYNIDFDSYFQASVAALAPFELEGLLTIAPDAIRVSNAGRLVIRNIANSPLRREPRGITVDSAIRTTSSPSP